MTRRPESGRRPAGSKRGAGGRGADSGPDGRAAGSAGDGPLAGWRRLVYIVCRSIAVGASKAYFPGEVIGRENLPDEGAYVLAPVHRSYVDWLIVARVTRRRLRYISKDSIWKWEWLGKLFAILGAFPVHRGTADREAFNRSVGALEAGDPLVLFPEGTRMSGPVVQPLLDGAAYMALRAGVPVVPVGLGGTERRMPKGASFPKPGRIRIVIGAPLRPEDYAGPATASGHRTTRVSRSATRRLSSAIRSQIQRSFDNAQIGLELTPASAEELAGAEVTRADTDRLHQEGN